MYSLHNNFLELKYEYYLSSYQFDLIPLPNLPHHLPFPQSFKYHELFWEYKAGWQTSYVFFFH